MAPPLPPSANLPAAPPAFAATRAGDALELTWRSSPRTTDGATQRGLVRPVLCAWFTARPRLPVPAALPCPRQIPLGAAAAAGAPGAQLLPMARLRLGLPASGPPPLALAAPFVRVALGFANRRGEVGAWSAFTLVSLAPAPKPPAGLRAVLAPDGVHLRWHALPPGEQPAAWRVFRRELAPQASAFTPLADLPGSAVDYRDEQIVWGDRYAYLVRAVGGAGPSEVLGPATAALVVNARNRFPPPAPTALRAVVAPGPPPAAVALSWLPVSTARLAGYNLYRRAAGAAEWRRLNPALLPTPVFRDSGVASGDYEYAATAVDEDGNESPRSAPASIHVP